VLAMSPVAGTCDSGFLSKIVHDASVRAASSPTPLVRASAKTRKRASVIGNLQREIHKARGRRLNLNWKPYSGGDGHRAKHLGNFHQLRGHQSLCRSSVFSAANLGAGGSANRFVEPGTSARQQSARACKQCLWRHRRRAERQLTCAHSSRVP
jgi:hypothetical protein